MRTSHKIFIVMVVLVIAGLWRGAREMRIMMLKGDFKVVQSHDSGPIRSYWVEVSDTLWSQMEKFGNIMPNSKLGSTEVHFVPENTDLTITVFSGEGRLSGSAPMFENCLARYRKVSGVVTFEKYPYK